MLPRDVAYSVPWNLMLITAGIYSVALKGIAEPHGFIPAGLFGVSVLIHTLTGTMGAGLWYLLLNIPMFALSWILIGRRFLLYSLYAMLVTAVSYTLLDVNFGIRNQLYAAVTCGALSGAGGGGSSCARWGATAASTCWGSSSGSATTSVWGKFYFVFNSFLFGFSFLTLDTDLVIASLILVFVASAAVEYCLSMFSQRKVALIISSQADGIAEDVMSRLRIGATVLTGHGAYKREKRKILMTVINNIQLKRLEELVFTRDPDALFIVENTFTVIGSTFARRKIY